MRNFNLRNLRVVAACCWITLSLHGITMDPTEKILPSASAFVVTIPNAESLSRLLPYPTLRNVVPSTTPALLLRAEPGSPMSELVLEDDDDDLEADWIPDREKARQKRLDARIFAEHVVASPDTYKPRSSRMKAVPLRDASSAARPKATPTCSTASPASSATASPYTEDEEDVIAAMGGKTFHRDRRREDGFLGDSTLEEIAQDYSMPICYLADVLCLWGVPRPINPRDRLGDLVTGEQAFALLEAVNSLDVSQVQDRYSHQSLLTVCNEWDIDLQTAFEFAVKEGWSLPFGVQTFLRVEQEDELLRVYAAV